MFNDTNYQFWHIQISTEIPMINFDIFKSAQRYQLPILTYSNQYLVGRELIKPIPTLPSLPPCCISGKARKEQKSAADWMQCLNQIGGKIDLWQIWCSNHGEAEGMIKSSGSATNLLLLTLLGPNCHFSQLHSYIQDSKYPIQSIKDSWETKPLF